MSTALRLTLKEYNAMVANGAFADLGDRRIELIYGELREMSPQGPPHSRAIAFLTRWSAKNTDEKVVEVRIQMPVDIPELDSQPEPDVVWAQQFAEARDHHPTSKEVFLLLEVSDVTVRNDLREKARLYARAGIGDYWVVDLQARSIHVFREPSPQGFSQHETLRKGELSPLAFPAVSLSIDDFFAWLR